MSNFTSIISSEIFEGNPFINNPHLKHISPYKEIYDRDKSKDKRKSSNEIYAIFIMTSPDEEENKYIKLSEEKRKELVETHFKINWNDKLIIEGLKDYPKKCMSIAELTLQGIQNKILERDAFLKSCPYTNDIYAKDSNGNFIAKGNTFLIDKLPPEKIDKMLRETAALYKEYSEAQKFFRIEKDNLIIRGGRMATDMESGELYTDLNFDDDDK
jgi:hypothetical protein